MTSERLFEVLGDMDETYIREAKGIKKAESRRKSDNTEEIAMSTRIIKNLKRPMIAIASLVLIVCLSGMAVWATAGKQQGFFKDITRWDGAVIGSVYEQATEEILLDVDVVDEKLILEIEMVNPEDIPYRAFEEFGIQSYEITDLEGNIVKAEDSAKITEVNNGTVTVSLLLGQIPAGKYRLIIREMIGSKKADQPLVLKGTWVCELVVE